MIKNIQFKSKKTSSSPLGSCDVETVHQLRMLQNRLMQWQYVNAQADAVKEKMTNQVENNLLYAWDTITNLEHLVLHKKLQLQKERLEMKQLDFILMSQIKPSESWGEMEGQHLAVSMMKECLRSVACKIPLIEGAKWQYVNARADAVKEKMTNQMEWQYVNARADAVKEKMTNQMKNNLLHAWDTITNLEHLVLHKKLQLQKERLEMKQLDFILMSQTDL
ncbi:QWRF motif-containing protein 3-like [Pistacia vera]|uniref:QWRF motif-containing protein 3-like n=1 Tax=Pistacia vera TaxID=55513 RepID=UPI001263BFDA|nr:QWRF motif-containing protein 3-like [Pistacia vera]